MGCSTPWSWLFLYARGRGELALWTVKGERAIETNAAVNGEMQAMGSRQPSAWSRLSRSPGGLKIPMNWTNLPLVSLIRANFLTALYRSGGGRELSMGKHDTGEIWSMHKWPLPGCRG